jgi:hypothetical protein
MQYREKDMYWTKELLFCLSKWLRLQNINACTA